MAAVAGLLALEGTARLFARPWPELDNSELRLETLSGEFEQGGTPSVLIVGDSIVYGEEVAYAEAYPAMLQRMWSAAHDDEPAVFVNGGVRGMTTLYGLGLLPLLVRKFQPQLVVIAFGLNDGHFSRSCVDARMEADFMVPRCRQLLRHSRLYLGLERRWRRWSSDCTLWEGKRWEPRVSGEAFVRALEDMLGQIEHEGATPVLLTTTPFGPNFGPELDPASRERQRQAYAVYNDLIRQTAARTGANLVDVFAGLRLAPEDWREDGLHLTPGGYRKLAEFLFSELEPRIRVN